MKRGEVWTAAGGNDYAGKPRLVVILQDERFDSLDSVTVCPITSDPTELPLFRLEIALSENNGLRAVSRIMVDKISTVPKTKLGKRIGRLDDEDMVRLARAAMTFLGLTRARAPRF